MAKGKNYFEGESNQTDEHGRARRPSFREGEGDATSTKTLNLLAKIREEAELVIEDDSSRSPVKPR